MKFSLTGLDYLCLFLCRALGGASVMDKTRIVQLL